VFVTIQQSTQTILNLSMKATASLLTSSKWKKVLPLQMSLWFKFLFSWTRFILWRFKEMRTFAHYLFLKLFI
jgi:hypothetical protein